MCCEVWQRQEWTVTPKSTARRRTLPPNASVNRLSQYGLICVQLRLLSPRQHTQDTVWRDVCPLAALSVRLLLKASASPSPSSRNRLCPLVWVTQAWGRVSADDWGRDWADAVLKCFIIALRTSPVHHMWAVGGACCARTFQKPFSKPWSWEGLWQKLQSLREAASRSWSEFQLLIYFKSWSK